ncbi:hypothetical protein ONZ45_g18842 [Pleurotus djamor]|nr:hypothetical protein ONZ45_g18842 [Pleurotus djamor]
MTERIRPLRPALASRSGSSQQEKEDWLLWGLHRVSVALAFINDSAASTHGNICTESIFISPSGEWKLGGFELLSNPKDEASVLYTLGRLMPSAAQSPEVKKGGWTALKDGDVAAADAYALGLLLHALFNPTLPLPATVAPTASTPTTLIQRRYPQLYISTLQEASQSKCQSPNDSKALPRRLDNFSLGNEAEKNALLKTLKESASSFPPEFASFRVLPSLVSALEFGGASAATILPLVLKFGENTSSDEYPKLILAPLVKLYASPDRGTRMALLDHLPEYADKLDKKIVSDQIWPHLQSGFSDTVAVIREATVKSISLLSSKLNDRLLNNDLLRFLARMQMDPEASIRTNTCILIGRLGPTLGYNTKRKVLVPAFSRALKDTFVHARVAGLMAFMATIDCFDPEDLATKVIPSMAFSMLDKEKLVRDQAFKAMELFVKKIEAHASTMPETVAAQESLEIPGGLGSVTVPTQATIVSSAAGAAGALAGWAMTSLGKKLVPSDLQSTMSSSTNGLSTQPITRPSSTPVEANVAVPGGFSSQPPQPERSTSSPAHGKALRLGGHQPSSVNAFVAELEKEASVANAWGSDDLMDVNADQDDWTAFESAPAPVISLEIAADDLGFDTPDDPWGNSTQITKPKPQPPKPQPQPKPLATNGSSSSRPSSTSRSMSSTGESSAAESWGSFTIQLEGTPKAAPSTPSTPSTPMSKEDRAAEMARRKEERKQRIAMLKEQKKHASSPS